MTGMKNPSYCAVCLEMIFRFQPRERCPALSSVVRYANPDPGARNPKVAVALLADTSKMGYGDDWSKKVRCSTDHLGEFPVQFPVMKLIDSWIVEILKLKLCDAWDPSQACMVCDVKRDNIRTCAEVMVPRKMSGPITLATVFLFVRVRPDGEIEFIEEK